MRRGHRSPARVAFTTAAYNTDLCGPQVDVTAADTVAPGKIPLVDSVALGQSKQATGMINTALQHIGLGPDPWKAITVGVMPTKPHTAVSIPPAAVPDSM